MSLEIKHTPVLIKDRITVQAASGKSFDILNYPRVPFNEQIQRENEKQREKIAELSKKCFPNQEEFWLESIIPEITLLNQKIEGVKKTQEMSPYEEDIIDGMLRSIHGKLSKADFLLRSYLDYLKIGGKPIEYRGNLDHSHVTLIQSAYWNIFLDLPESPRREMLI